MSSKAYHKKYREVHKAKRAAYDKAYRAPHKAELQAKAAEYGKAYRAANKEKLAANKKVWATVNRTAIRKQKAAYRKQHSERDRNKWKIWVAAHPGRSKAIKQRWQEKNAEKVAAKHALYVFNNPEKVRETKVRSAAKNRAKKNAGTVRRTRYRYRTDAKFRLVFCCRSRVGTALRRAGVKKTQKSFDLIGCSPSFLRDYLEVQFTPEMSWENYGTVWHVDHIIPIASFDLSDLEQRHKAFHYSNCRPLEAMANRMKGSRMPNNYGGRQYRKPYNQWNHPTPLR